MIIRAALLCALVGLGAAKFVRNESLDATIEPTTFPAPKLVFRSGYGHDPHHGNSGNPSNIERQDIFAYCSHRDTIQLGPCSRTYVKCNRYIRKVDYAHCGLGKVFNAGSCIDVSEVAFCKTDVNVENLETEQLAERQSLCKRSPNSVFVAPPQNQCSRQGLLCDQSGQPLSFVCPFGQILDPIFLSCITDQNRCSRVPKAVSSTVKNSLLRQHCSRKTVVDSFVPGDSAHTDYGTCDTWYIDCRVHFQALIHCEPGRLYDPYMKMCRLSSYHDQCRLATSCLGYEWNILPAGRCKTEFVFCEGLNPKKFVCDHGKVFHKGKCVSLEHSECPLCELGETKASTECSKYFKCHDFGVRRSWKEMSCSQGQGFSESERKCVTDFACSKIEKCRPGSSYKFSCTDYMVCLNGEYEYRSCPRMTSWSVRNSQCEYDPKCLKPGEEKVCREGDVIPSVNCETYKRCRHGEFVKKNCDRFAGNGACSHCYSENQDWRDFCPSPDSGFADFKPVHCRHGDRFVNPESCNEYVECLEGVWYTRVCPAGHVYDKQSNGCRRSKSLSCGLGNDSVYMPSKEDDNDDEYKTDDRFVDKRETCDSRSVQKIADIYDCAKYKVCNLRSGFYEDRSCLFGEQFDRRKGECVWGHKCNPEECTEGTRFPRPECGKLQYCKDGMLQNFKCKNGAVFENNFCSKTKFCKDYEGHLYPLTCAEGMTAEHTSDCSKYLICFRNNFVERQCVSGQNFNPELGKCDYKYRCKATNVPTCYHGETRAVPHKCDQFELCQDSRFALQSCPFGTVYNPHRMRCEPGKCEKTKNPSDQRGSEKCKESSLPDGFKPHPTDCGRFYHCAHGRWVPKSCQPGLVFNPALAVCDWPRNVPGCD